MPIFLTKKKEKENHWGVYDLFWIKICFYVIGEWQKVPNMHNGSNKILSLKFSWIMMKKSTYVVPYFDLIIIIIIRIRESHALMYSELI